MKKNIRTLRLIAMLLAAACTAAAQDLEISGFRVPEYDEQGVMTSQLFGERAEMKGDGNVNITGLRIDFYDDGETVMEVTSPFCVYNQQTEEAHSDAPVHADMDRVQMSGRGFEMQPGANAVRVLNDSVVTIYDVMQQMEQPEPAAINSNEVTIITSKEMLLDYDARTVWFRQNVQVEDARLKMDCETLEVRFNENNEIEWIQALGDVILLNEGREAVAETAVYDMDTDEFVLSGSPRIIDGRSMLLGERIRFWRGSSRMVCEPSARLVIYPGEQDGENLFEN